MRHDRPAFLETDARDVPILPRRPSCPFCTCTRGDVTAWGRDEHRLDLVEVRCTRTGTRRRESVQALVDVDVAADHPPIELEEQRRLIAGDVARVLGIARRALLPFHRPASLALEEAVDRLG
jgi:hypothetical protein